MLSCIIPSYKDPLVHKTTQSILDNAVGEVEVICVFDGYWDTPIDDPRVKVIHLGKNRGMRGAINAGVSIASGDILMRTDEHCSFAKGFDKVIAESIKDDEIVVPTRYFLDPRSFTRMNLPPVNFAKLVIKGGKFTAENWKERDEEMKDVMVGETMGMQGSCWFMKKVLWDNVIVELQTEGYGHLIQDSHEMVFKVWRAGGRLMLNKNTWYAHKHRKFPRTHNNGAPENPANCTDGYKYALDVWGDYYYDVVCPKWGLPFSKSK